MVVRKIIERTLEEGQTSITITDTDIPGSLIRTYSNDPDLMPVQLVLTGSTLKIDYEAQSTDKYVAVELVKQGLDIIDNLTSTDTDAALSAKQGKVLKDLVDYITPIRELTELDDVLVTDLTDGDILKYDAEEEKFVNYLLPDIPVYLGDLGDIVLDTVTSGQVLTYNGAYWTNADPADAGEIYSTDEQIIGKWIDNRNIYKRTYVLESNLLVSKESFTDTGITIQNLDNILRGEFVRIQNNGYMACDYRALNGAVGVRNSTNYDVTFNSGSILTLVYIKTV